MPSPSSLPLFASVLTVDLGFAPEEESFRQEVRDWLDANLPQAWKQDGKGGYREEEDTDLQREWQRRLYEGGWLKLAWPREVGGRGARHAGDLPRGDGSRRRAWDPRPPWRHAARPNARRARHRVAKRDIHRE